MNIPATPLRALRVLSALIGLCFALPAFAETFFVTQAGAGAANGTSLANAWSAADFNNAANWGAGAGQIKAGDTVFFSGQFSVRLIIRGSGTSESNRIILTQAPSPGLDAVLIGFDGSGRNYIAVLGLEFTQTSGDVGAFDEVIRISNSTGWLIQDNYFHHTRGGGVSGQPNTTNTFNIIRGNIFEDLTSVVKGSNGHATMQLYGHSNLIEYNTVLGSLDRTRAFGTGNVIRNNYFGPTRTTDYPLDISVQSVLFANLAARGEGYTSPPTVTFIGDVVAGGTAAAVSAVTLGVVKIVVDTGGTGYTSAPTVIFSGGGMTTSATATAIRTGDAITAVTVNTVGSFTGVATVSFSGGGGTGATATAIMGVGNVTVANNNNRGYTVEPAVSFSGGGFTIAATATARLDPHHVDSFQSFENAAYPLNKLLFERNLDHDNQDPIGGTNAHGFLIQNNDATAGMEWAIARFNVIIRPGGVAYQLRSWKRFYGYNLTSISVQSANNTTFNSAVTFDNPAASNPANHNDIQDWRNNTWSNMPRTVDNAGIIASNANRGTNFTSARQHTFNYGPTAVQARLPGDAPDATVPLVLNLDKTDPKFANHAVGTLTTRTNDTTGVITLSSGSVATGQTVTISWHLVSPNFPGGRTGMTVGTVVGNTVPISGGVGFGRNVNFTHDILPPTSTVIQVWTSDDYKMASDSPLRGTGTGITQANGAGVASTTLVVDDSKRLFDGWGIADGDIIKIGAAGSYVRITSIDYDTHTVTLAAARSWADNDPVFVKGSEDVGALPFDYATDFSVRNTTPRAPPVGANNLTATVTNPDAVRMVQFIVNGIPVGIAYDAPYAVTWAGADGVTEHNVEARAYSAWATKELWASQLNGFPNFTTHPTSQAVPLATNVTLSVVVEGDPAPALQWKKDGVDVTDPNTSGANTANLEITNFGAGNIGTYTVVATNSVGVATSNEAIVTSGSGIPLTVTGVVANNKVYNGTATTTLNTAGHALVGITDGHVVTLNAAGGVGTFVAGAGAGDGKSVTVTGLALSGADAGLYVLVQPTGLTANITPKALTVTGLSATNRIYNATTVAPLAGTAALQTAQAPGTGTSVDGIPYTGDTVSVTGTPAGAFADRHVGNNKPVTVSGLSLSGAQAANYTLTHPTGLTANVTAKTLNVLGLTANSKVYDATVVAGLSGTAGLPTAQAPGAGTTVDGVPYTGDTVSLTGTGSGTFADRHVAAAKPVTVTGFGLSGGQASNYALAQPSGLTANITTKTLTVAGLASANKVYDATTTAALTGTAALQTAQAPGAGTTVDGIPYNVDTVSLTGTASGAFADRHVGNNKAIIVSGLSLTGGQASNYTVTAPASLTANVTAKALTVSGLAANSRVYDATTVAALTGTAALQAAQAPGVGTTVDGIPYNVDTVALAGTAAGAFADRHIGTGKAVTVSGITLSGAQATNYTVVQPTGLTANVTVKALTVAGVAASNKIYDATSTAPLTGTAALQAAQAPGAGTTVDGVPYTGDTVSLDGTAAGTFSDRHVGAAKPVTVTGLSLAGTQATNYTLTAPAGLTANITTKALTVAGLSAAHKVYDATTAAALTGTAALQAAQAPGAGTSVDGIPYTGDTVSLDGTATGTFADRHVGNNKAIVISGLSLGGAQASNYTVTAPASLTANVTAKALTVSGLAASSRVYDATTIAALTGTAALQGAQAPGAGTTSDGNPYTGDTVSLAGTAAGAFADRHIGTGKAVTVSGITLGGAEAANYTVIQPTGLAADVTAKALTVAGVAAANRVYDATLVAPLTGTAVLQGAQAPGAGTTSDGNPYTGDTITLTGTATGAFADRHVGAGKAVTVSGLSLGGAQSTNYTLTAPAGLTADITAKALTVAGLAVANKVYDATTAAALSGTAALQSAQAPGAGTTSDGVPYTGDTVSLDGTAAGAFADRHVGVGKPIVISGLSLSGAQSTNYTVTAPAGLVANITAKALTVSGLTATNRVYDATLVAPLTGTAALQGAQAPGAGTTSDGNPYTGDTVSLTGTAAGAFTDRHVGVAKAVTVSGLSLDGAQNTNYTLTPPVGLAADVTAKALTVAGVTPANRVYDATLVAPLTGTAALQAAHAPGAGSSVDGIPYTGDTVALDGTAAGAFADRHVGAAKPVTVTGLSLAGTQATNYTLTAPAGLTADITTKALTVTGIAASNRVYDATTAASLTGTAALQAAQAPGAGTTVDGIPYAGDTVSLDGTATGAFADRHVGNNKAIVISGLSLTGAQAANYTVTAPASLTANVTAKALTVGGLTASSRVYDATSTAALTGTAALQAAQAPGAGTTVDGVPYTGDTIALDGAAAGAFADRHVGAGKAVTVSGITLSGAQATNYTVTQPVGLTADITAKALTVTGLAASSRVYNATTVAPLTGTAALQGAQTPGTGTTVDGIPYIGDAVLLTGTAAGAFADRHVGASKPVTVSGLSLGGAQSTNYTVTAPAGLTANITAKPLNITGVTAANKPYDGLTTVVLGGAAALPAAQTPGAGTTIDGVPYTGDDVSLTGTATGAFATASAGVAKPVVISGLTLGGGEAGNYSLNAAATTANITPLALTIAGVVANNRAYDATTAASFNVAGALLTGVLVGDVADVTVTGATGTFANANIGIAKPVTVSAVTLGGAAAGNYLVTPPAGLTANITAVNLTISGLAALDKVFDGGTSATFNIGSASLTGVVPADAGSVTIASVSGSFADSAIGPGKAVTVTAVTLGGAAAGNYTVTLPGVLAASILEPTSAPVIVAQPASQTVNEGATVSFTVIVSGIPTPDIQWRKNDIIVPGALSATLTLSAVDAADAGSYVAIASNSVGTATSAAATLTVNTAPVIASHPVSQSVVSGSNVTFTVVATGSGTLSYQWRKGGVAIAGATSAAFALTNVPTTAAGGYDVVVSNSVGSVTSNTAVLTVNLPNYAGTYFGTFSSGGTWALHVREDNTATLLAFLPEQESAIVLDLIINPDGTFSVAGSAIASAPSFASLAQPGENGGTTPPRAAAGAAFVLSGSIQNGQVTGELGGLGLTLSGAADAESGPAEGIAGFYTAAALGTDSATTYSIIGPSGQMITVTTGLDFVDGASGTVGADGKGQATTAGGARIALTVNTVNQSIATAYTPAGAAAPLTFAGVPDTVVATANLINLSVRSSAGSGDDTLIAGFVVTGASPKTLLVRGIGPTLGAFGVTNPLADPVINFYSGTALAATNDDWGVPVGNAAPITAATIAAGAFALPDGSRDAVLITTANSGQHSVHLSTKSGAAGVALIELYDTASGGPARLANVSARSLVGTGANVLIVGFVVDGNVPRQVLIRGIGPGLTQFGVTGVLADPQLSLYSGSTTLLYQNQVWGGTSTLNAAFNRTGAFTLPQTSRDAALLVTLQPGQYSVVVSGVGNTTGVALVEVYEVP